MWEKPREKVKLPREKLQCEKERMGAWDSAQSLVGWKRSLWEIQADFKSQAPKVDSDPKEGRRGPDVVVHSYNPSSWGN